jgi:hypothetical protein
VTGPILFGFGFIAHVTLVFKHAYLIVYYLAVDLHIVEYCILSGANIVIAYTIVTYLNLKYTID